MHRKPKKVIAAMPIANTPGRRRLGGLLRRTDSCRRRLLDYTSGKIDEIPELAFELLEGTVPNGSNNCYGKMCTPNRLTHKIL